MHLEFPYMSRHFVLTAHLGWLVPVHVMALCSEGPSRVAGSPLLRNLFETRGVYGKKQEFAHRVGVETIHAALIFCNPLVT
jgi:hypothetical protein